MDKYEYKHLVDEIQYLIDQQEYAKAAEIADTIDWRRVRSVMTLGTISDLYRINKRYEDARDIMLMAYDRKPENSQVCYSLCELFIKTGEMADAVEFYKEYERLTPADDPSRFILQYKMYEANNVSLEERAEVLENLRQREYQEKWLYELAYLYHRMELETKCVEICDELILWFGSGEYVNKALELKRLHAPLTPEQQAKYDSRFEQEEFPAEEEPENIPEEDALDEHVWERDQDTGEIFEENGDQFPGEDNTRTFDAEEVRRQTGEYTTVDGDTAPMVKIMDMGQYNTLNLQAEIAAGVNEVLNGKDAVTRTILKPMIDPETGYYGIGSTTEIMDSVNQNTENMEPAESTEVYFGETGELQQTGEIPELQSDAQEEYAEEETVFSGQPVDENVQDYDQEDEILNSSEAKFPEEQSSQKETEESRLPIEEVSDPEGESAFPEGTAADLTAEGAEEPGEAYEDSYAGYVEEGSAAEKTASEGISIADRVMEQMRLESLEAQRKLENEALTAQPPEPMARALTQEPDGQIRLVVPEGRKLEKQITGQLSIEDIRAEWERMKQESREKQEEEVRQRVQRQTGKMFTEFEEALRDNILKQMEKKEDPSLYEFLEAAETNDGQESDVAEKDDWAMDEWMSDTGEPEEDAVTPEEGTSDGSAESAGDDISENYADETEDMEETIEPEETGETFEETAEETAEPEETFEETAEETAEPEETFEETAEETAEPEETFEETAEEPAEPEETAEAGELFEEPLEEDVEASAEPERVSEGLQGTSEKREEIPEETAEMTGEYAETAGEASEEAGEYGNEPEEAGESEDTEEPPEDSEEAVTGDSWEDDEYPDFSEEEKAVTETKPDEEEHSKEDTDRGDDVTGGQGAKKAAAEEISSETPPVRALTEEEESLFGELIQGRSAREQLVKAIDSISMAAYAGNLVITSEESGSALEMAKNIIREIKQTDSNFSGKAARISGRKMNGKKISDYLEQLKNGALIIDNASKLSEETLADLYKCMQQDSYGLLVILIDTKKKINLFLKENKKFAPMFGARVDLQPLSNDVLAEYAQQYAREKEFSIDDLGMLALHTRIDEMQTAKHSVTKAEIEDLMNAAIDSASRKNVGHFFDILLGRRYDDEDMIIITEKDFE